MKRYLAATLVCALAALPVYAASPLGGLTVSGAVWTNQAALPSGSNVYAGDEIRTAPGAFAVLQSPATGRIELRGDTQARVGERTITLERGVVASQKLTVEVDDIAVRATNPQADNWFVVENQLGRSLVAVYRGEVVIRGGSAGWLEVPAGSYAMAVADPLPKESESETKDVEAKTDDEDSNDKRRAGGAAGAGAKAGWSIGSLSHAASVVVVTGATAAVLGGAVAAGAFEDESASPQD